MGWDKIWDLEARFFLRIGFSWDLGKGPTMGEKSGWERSMESNDPISHTWELSTSGTKMTEFPSLDRLERPNPKVPPLGWSKLSKIVAWMGFSSFFMDNHRFLGWFLGIKARDCGIEEMLE